jgi:hypothetical protein
MSRPPEFDELVGGVEDADERERLRRVHELLIEAGPPPELSPALASVAPPVDAAPADEEERDFSWLPRRRLGAGLVLVGAVLAATFGLGYLAGGSDSGGGEAAGVEIVRTASLTGESDATGVVNVGRRSRDGNWPMILTVRGLAPLMQGDYYVLALSKDGKPVVTCGTFNVADRGNRTLRMSAAYNLRGFDGWVVTRYDARTHRETPVLWSKGALKA